ncbi:MAG: hypothetical protein KO202_06015 [Methanobacteriaceae archaeon]|jgi:hypothetical protein|nr:hypothetical protein [Methanobacteriaceae archaeon]
MSTPILAYLKENKEKFNNVAFFSTSSANEADTFDNMEKLISKKPLETLSLNKKDFQDSYESKIDEFAQNIKNHL